MTASNKLFIPILLGTGREGRRSEVVAKFVLQVVQEHSQKYNLETELFDIRDGLTRTGETGKKFSAYQELIKRADGLIVVAPEYNHGYPGELKLVLDQLYEEYNRKPIAFCGVSAGPIGGARMIEQLRLVAIELQMVPIRNAVYFGNVSDLFNEKGEVKNLSYADRLIKMLDELIWYARVLKYGRKS
jgi:NAD(P)H-dependent FMN reductase